MASTTRFGWLKLISIFSLLLSLWNIAIASPVPSDTVSGDRVDTTTTTLEARTDPYAQFRNFRTKPTITQSQYMGYLRRHFHPNLYIFYSGSSSNQVKTFISYNRAYHNFDSLFNALDTNHLLY
ncbi:hypothetical protein P171DRAFT_486023 [Karstenula rhodostoma CBS 690.94]|uniref:Uncharacterized protein n=1 Tax=Karstenula rhodostoma CBS 690.94 TaxID=1392251 RepID=A0A9P4PKL7_9PLEO|nr:hypothetical protein P171DRAFT_486023 [Karstenula rhodostoma CBS 690.94]